MRIHDAYTKLNPAESRASRDVSADAKSTEGRAGARAGHGEAVKVSLSTKALEKSAAAEPDHAKVERLRKAIESGQLPIDARLIAARLVEENG